MFEKRRRRRKFLSETVMKRNRNHETDSEGEAQSSSDAKRPKKAAVKQRFVTKYTELWPCLAASSKGEHFVRCKLCNKDFSCAHGGQNDCKKHVNSLYHKDMVSRSTNSRAVTDFFTKSSTQGQTTSLERQTMSAEVEMCYMISDLNLPLSTADMFTQRFKSMFPDSAIAKGMNF